MSINVLQRIMAQVFTSLGHTVNDPWKDQTAIKLLQIDAKSDIIQSRSFITYHFGRHRATSYQRRNHTPSSSSTITAIATRSQNNTSAEVSLTTTKKPPPSTQQQAGTSDDTGKRCLITHFFKPSNRLITARQT